VTKEGAAQQNKREKILIGTKDTEIEKKLETKSPNIKKTGS